MGTEFIEAGSREEAVKRAKAENPDASMISVGKGPEKGEWRVTATERGEHTTSHTRSYYRRRRERREREKQKEEKKTELPEKTESRTEGPKRKYFGSKAARNRYLEKHPGYVTGMSGKGNYFAERRTLTEKEAADLGYSESTREKMVRSGRLAPKDIKSMSGTPEEIAGKLAERYKSGKINPQYSARIVPMEGSSASKVEFYRTPEGKQSTLNYFQNADIAQTSDMPEGDMKYRYNIGLQRKEQIKDVRAWAQERGLKVRRVYPEDSDSPITLQVMSPEKLPKDTMVEYRSAETIRRQEAREGTEGLGKEVYEKASPLERLGLHVRTLLSPAGYEYVGSVAHTGGAKAAMGPINAALLEMAFPSTGTSPKGVVEKDISRRAERQATGKKYTVMGQEVPDWFISAVHNPVVDVETMALGGAGTAKVAATKLGGRIITSTAGKVGAGILTAGYTAERAYRTQQLRQAGESEKALGTAITAAAGLFAAGAAFRAEYSHIARVRAARTIELDVSKIKGGSVTQKLDKPVINKFGKFPKGSVSKGGFRVTEGKLKGLRGETFSWSGKHTGRSVTYIPKQTIGTGKAKIVIPEQTVSSPTKHGTLSKALKIYWQRSGNWIVGRGKQSKIIGPRRETAAYQEVGSHRGKVGMMKKLPGGVRVKIQRSALIRKFSGVGAGKQARKYDLAFGQRGDRAFLVQRSITGKKSLTKYDWVDVALGGRAGGRSGGAIRGGGLKTMKPASAVKTKPPAMPSGAVKTAATPKTAKIVWTANPTPKGPAKVKRGLKTKTKEIAAGSPTIVRRGITAEKEKERTVVSRASTAIGSLLKPGIKRGEKLTPRDKLLPAYHPITGQRVSEKERTALRSKLEPIVDRVPPQPPGYGKTQKVTTGGGLPLIPPYLKMGPSAAILEKFGKDIKKNPVPDIRKVV